MKIVKRSYIPGGPGFVKVVPEEAEDLWHAYNLIAHGDNVASTTMRKVQRETAGGEEAERVRLKLEIDVEAVEYDAVAAVLRVRGKNTSKSDHEVWDSIAIGILKEASDPATSADVAAVMMQEGLANLCLVGGSVTTVKARIETSMPRKRGPAIAGYDKDQFAEYMYAEAARKELRAIIENKSKIILAHASSAYKHALKEVLSVPAVMAQIRDTKAAREVKGMEEFYAMLSADSARAFYGPGHVEAANERLAIQTLLITDALFRNADIIARRKYVDLVESVREGGGEVLVFSSQHVSGEQLAQLTGIAAILRFPLPDIEDMEL
eukprot:jgi/Mesen1/4404/ME000225S03393